MLTCMLVLVQAAKGQKEPRSSATLEFTDSDPDVQIIASTFSNSHSVRKHSDVHVLYVLQAGKSTGEHPAPVIAFAILV